MLKKINYKKARENLENDDLKISGCLCILMQWLPYRRNIIQTDFPKQEHVINDWDKFELSDQLHWINENMLKKYKKEELIDHLIKALKMSRFTKYIRDAFIITLDLENE